MKYSQQTLGAVMTYKSHANGATGEASQPCQGEVESECDSSSHRAGELAQELLSVGFSQPRSAWSCAEGRTQVRAAEPEHHPECGWVGPALPRLPRGRL